MGYVYMAKKKKTVEKKFKLDVNDVLSALDCCDQSFYKQLPEDGKKSIALQEVILRWLSAISSDQLDWDEARKQGRKKGDGKGPWPKKDDDFTGDYLMIVNDGPNMSFGYHELYGHEELEWMLMAMVGLGDKQEHVWIPASPKSDTPTIDAIFRNKYPLANIKEINMLKALITKDELLMLVNDYGNPDKLSDNEAAKMKQKHGAVFDKKTVLLELKKIGK